MASRRNTVCKEKPYIPKLIDVLPREGFEWSARHGAKSIIENRLARKITVAFRRLLPRFDAACIEYAIANMFRAATDVIDAPITCSPEEFWAEVKKHVTWHRNLDAHTILLFSWKVLSANNIATEMYNDFLEMEEMSAEDHPKPTTVATQAVDAFTQKIVESQSFDVRSQLLPGWIWDSDNQSDEESTTAVRHQKIENQRQGRPLYEGIAGYGYEDGQESDGHGDDGGQEEEEHDADEDGDIEMGEASEGSATFTLAFRPRN